MTDSIFDCGRGGFVIRVNQLGYESGRLMRGCLMTIGPDDGASYSVLNSKGEVVSSGVVESSVGEWGSFTVYPLDFRLRKNDF